MLSATFGPKNFPPATGYVHTGLIFSFLSRPQRFSSTQSQHLLRRRELYPFGAQPRDLSSVANPALTGGVQPLAPVGAASPSTGGLGGGLWPG